MAEKEDERFADEQLAQDIADAKCLAVIDALGHGAELSLIKRMEKLWKRSPAHRKLAQRRAKKAMTLLP